MRRFPRKAPDGAILPNNHGYLREKVQAQSNEGNIGWPLQHRTIVERIRGKALPRKSVVHHVNGNIRDNRPANLVVCENQAYHFLLELRTRALHACGNPALRHCYLCDKWDDPNTMRRNGIDNCFIHHECRRKRRRELAAIWRATGRKGSRP